MVAELIGVRIEILNAFMGAFFGVWCGEIFLKLELEITYAVFFTLAIACLAGGLIKWTEDENIFIPLLCGTLFLCSIIFWCLYTKEITGKEEISSSLKLLGVLIYYTWIGMVYAAKSGWLGGTQTHV